MRLPSAQEILFLHDHIIETTGGSHGIRDLNGLQAALARPNAGYGDVELFPSLHLKVAALLDALVRYHPFVGGNKRTGIAAAGITLAMNRYPLTATNDELVSFTLHVAVEHPDVEQIAAWQSERSAQGE